MNMTTVIIVTGNSVARKLCYGNKTIALIKSDEHISSGYSVTHMKHACFVQIVNLFAQMIHLV